ncbi:hypothetical protein OROGR_016727 [Orobanche gracilis]
MMDTNYTGSLLPNLLHMEGDHDPHANYRTNPSSYLAIDGDTGQYSISYYPPKIPKGFTIAPHRRFHGLRQFLVTKDDDDDTYDLVNVGTMMVQNGYAYVAGTGTEQLRKKHEDELKEIIKSDVEWTDITQPRILEFRLTWKNSISPTCSACGAELLDRFCPDCGFESLQVENAVNESDKYFGGYQSTEMQLGSDFGLWDCGIKAGWLKWKSATGVLCDPDMPHRLKGKFYRTAIRPTLLYGTECWAVKQCHVQKMNVAEMRMLRWMCGHTKKDRLRNEVIREKVRVASIEDKIMENRLRWFGHVRRIPVDAPVRRLESWRTINIVKGRDRPKKTWIKLIENDMRFLGIGESMVCS